MKGEREIFAKEYEQFLINGDETACNSLPNGSLEKEYFFLIRQILKEEYSLDLEKKIKAFFKNFSSNKKFARLKALLIYKKMQKNPEKKGEIIKEIKDLFNIGNAKNYSKPVKYSKITKEESENEEKKITHKLNYEEYVKVYRLIDDIYSGKIIPTDDNIKNILGGNYFQDELDFNKIPIDTLIKIALKKEEFNNIKIDGRLPINSEHFEKLIKLLNDECIKDQKNIDKIKFFIKDEFHDNLSNGLIETILKYDNFNFDFLLTKIFNQMVIPFLNKKTEEALKELLKIKNKLSKYKGSDGHIKYIILKILDINSSLNKYDLNIFIEYIKLPLRNDNQIYNINKELTKKIVKNLNIQDNILFDILKDEKKIIEKHIKHFYLNEKVEFNKFSQYFNENYIKKFYAKMQFYSGSETPIKDNILTREEIENLMKEIILNISDNNKERFNINEDIEIILEIKNIQSLLVNIYEINTENYYYLNHKEFDTNISLDGIIPTFDSKFSFNEKPQLLLNKKISLSQIPKKRGLFVVEFIGNGHVSRAVIQRGYLKWIHKNTINGKVIYILDEENQILKGEKTGIWMNNVWYPSLKDSGAVLIPYSTKGNEIVLKHNDFCCLINDSIQIPEETYSLNGQFIINEESFIMGNVTKILLRAYLYVCDEICPLENLKNIKLTITTITTENNQEIPSLNIIDINQLSYDQEFSFDFPVPPKLKLVEFALTAKIRNKSKDKDEDLFFNQKFQFTRNYEYDTLIKKNEEGEYLIHFLGKNGEPKINHSIGLKLNHSFQTKINNDNQILLESNSEGIINLGKLKDIRDIKLDYEKININKSYNYTFNEKIIILEEDIINIPFKSQENNKIFLINNLNKENLTNLLKIKITDEKNKLGNITLPKLTKGDYYLNINNTYFYIQVIKGNKMNINNYIITDEEDILYYNNAEPVIYIEKVSYQNKELKIKLNKTGKNLNHPRVHISCVQYYPKRLNGNIESFKESNYFKKILEIKKFKSEKYENCYLNNKILSDEIQYVLDRKQYQINLGNSLENPSLLLKPQFIRETTTEIKKGKEGREFMDYSRDYEKREFNPYKTRHEALLDEAEDSDLIYDQNKIRIHDFINVSPYIKENLIPDDNGEIIIKNIDLNEYSFLHILCFDNKSCNEDWFYLNNGKTSLRDLRAKNDLDLDKNYCEFRKIYPLNKNDKHHINDITSIKYKIFDSLEKYLEFIKLVNPALNEEIKEFNFLLNFDNFNLQEKLEKLTQYFSHEVNIYLYFHHNEFFLKYIFPIIKYKSEKTFIDYFLINDKNKIKEYSKAPKISKLNIFEKCLLIYSIRNENKELSNSLAREISHNVKRKTKRN